MATESLSDVLERIKSDASGNKISVDDLVSAFESRGFGALLVIIGLIAAMPLVGALPGVSIITGTLVLLIAIQFIFGRRHPWIPAFLRNKELDRETVEKGIDESKPYASWVDKHVNRRMKWFVTNGVAKTIVAVFCAALAVTMLPLALVPWGVMPPALAIAFFGLAIIAGDGVMAAIGFVLSAATLYVLYISWGILGSFF